MMSLYGNGKNTMRSIDVDRKDLLPETILRPERICIDSKNWEKAESEKIVGPWSGSICGDFFQDSQVGFELGQVFEPLKEVLDLAAWVGRFGRQVALEVEGKLQVGQTKRVGGFSSCSTLGHR